MVRNISVKTDDDFDDKIYSVSKKRGMSKSAFIRNTLEKAIEREYIDKGLPNISILNNPSEGVNVNLDEKKDEKKSSDIVKVDIRNKDQTSYDINTYSKPELNQEQKLELKELKDLKEETKSQVTMPEEKSLPDKEQKLNDDQKDVKQEDIKQGFRKKFKIGKVNRVNDENIITTGLSESDVERKVKKILDQQNFNQSFDQMHKKIDSVCADGKCLKDEMTTLKTSLGKIDSICEDGKCLRTEVGNIKKDLEELKNLKSHFESLDNKISKKEPCPNCNMGIEETSSYCPNCGLEIKEWYDEKGNKLDWKPFKLRNK